MQGVRRAHLVVGDSSLAAEGQAPAFEAPATHVQHAWDEGVLVHLVLDVETHCGRLEGGVMTSVVVRVEL